MKLSSVADKFAMKLGLESRPAPSAATTQEFDYTEDFDTSSEYSEVMSDELSEESDSMEADFRGVYDADSAPSAYLQSRNFPFNSLLHNIKLHSSKLNELMTLKDFSNALGEIDHLQETLSALQYHILEKVDGNPESVDEDEITQIKSTASYMYEPEEYTETDDDRDFDTYWEYYTGEVSVMDEDELYKEEKKLKIHALSSLESDDAIHPMILRKLKEVRRKMKKSTDEHSIMADIMSDAAHLSSFIE